MKNRKIANFKNAFRKFAQTIFFKGNAQIVSLSNNSFELLQLLYEYTEHNPSRETGDGKVRVAGPITSLYCILGHDTLIFRCLFLPGNTNGKCWTVHVGGTCQGPVSPHPGEGGGSNSPGCLMLQKPGEFRQKSHWIRGRVRLTVGSWD